MATVKQLIEQLQEIEDKDQTVMFQYFLAEHFDLDGDSPTAEQFDQAFEDLDDYSLWDDAAETINDYLCGLMTRERNN
jgi:hypothetical protein